MPQDPGRTPDEPSRLDDAVETPLPGEDVGPEKPIEVKRTPRLRSGKVIEPESTD